MSEQPEITGDFEIHLTVHDYGSSRLAEFAARHGLKYVHVVLDRGITRSQPMLTLAGTGSLADQHSLAGNWAKQLRDVGLHPARTKIEAAPWCTGVPATDAEAAAEPAGRYFEHHVKLLLPAEDVAALLAVAAVGEQHGARLSRNARRVRADGRQERFLTQRCHGVGRESARYLLDRLVAALREASWEIASVEQEYVVYDDHLSLDADWLVEHPVPEHRRRWEDQRRVAPAGAAGYPATCRPLPDTPGMSQRAAFDPALKQHANAYRAGEPEFADRGAWRQWTRARRTAMAHLLNAVLRTPWAGQLVLRGSVTMSAWFGGDAREPGDVDFVVEPFSMASRSPEATAMLDGIVAELRERPGAGLDPEQVKVEEIWTYERADGRRLVIPFTAPGVPGGSVQVDFVFNEHLPIEPVAVLLDGVDVAMRAASPALSLAWKLMWLATDRYPQGKDLYDAVLLAEHTAVDLALVRDLMRPELREEADAFTAGSVLEWDVDWENFTDEYPSVAGDGEVWKRRLALALHRNWFGGA
ncbi:nucleotidyl transferase AbiEii/AbiGii toxin family protein [Catellatospora sichuanensis]|uniref:nucleotidyl transferase AbiEii/AbiGii toxin family protein n=1 Tax=Catellatospora sichuanensis TaxID=1969805 RepID=UPI001182E87B|nr:nucleotidyl transferase AbiEii/AbiGii toxin family protein [Catellatospora sichuanensis]